MKYKLSFRLQWKQYTWFIARSSQKVFEWNNVEDVLSVLSEFCISEAGDPSDRAVWGVGLRPLAGRNWGFESRR